MVDGKIRVIVFSKLPPEGRGSPASFSSFAVCGKPLFAPAVRPHGRGRPRPAEKSRGQIEIDQPVLSITTQT